MPGEFDELSEEEKLRAVAYVRGSGNCRGRRTGKTAEQTAKKNFRRAQVLAMLEEGRTEAEIRQRLGIGESTAYRDFKFISALYLRESIASRHRMLSLLKAEIRLKLIEMDTAWQTSIATGKPPDRGYVDSWRGLVHQLLETTKLEVDPRIVGELKRTPDLLLVECADRDDVNEFEDIVEFKAIRERLKYEGDEAEGERDDSAGEDMDAL